MKRAGIRGRTVLILAGVFLLVFIIYLLLSLFVKEKKTAFSFTGVAADGSHVTLSENFGERGTALIFYNTELPVAIETVRLFEKYASDYPTVDIMPISLDEGTLEERIEKSKKAGLTLFEHTLFDVDGDLAALYNVTTQIPCIYFIDKDGIVQDTYPVHLSERSLQKELNSIA